MPKKKRNTDDERGTDVTSLMTVSLFLILLSFFILLNSLAVIDEIKVRATLGSLLGAFGSFKGGLSPLSTGQSIMPPGPPMIEEELDLESLMSLIEEKMEGQVKIEPSRDRAIITINEKALFDENKSKLKSSSYPLLDKLCTFIREKDYPVEIVGHTDNRPAQEKGYKSNWGHSALMAIQMLRYFAEEGKVPPERLTPYGYGSYEPIVSNDTRQSRAQNRRVEIILHFEPPSYIKRIYRKRPAGIFSYKRFDFRVFSE